MGVIVPYETRSDQASFDTLLPQIDTALATMLSGGSTAKKLSGLNDIGDIRTGATAVNKTLNLALRFDVVVFRR